MALKGNQVALAQNISANGQYCQITVVLPLSLPANPPFISDVIDSVYYIVQTSTGVTAGAVGVQGLLATSTSGSLNWVTLTTANSTTGAAFTLVPTLSASTVYNGSLLVTGSIFTPIQGIRLNITGLTGGNIALAQLTATFR